MKTVAIDGTPPTLEALVEEVKRGVEVRLTENAKPVARLVPLMAGAERAAWAKDLGALFARLRAVQKREPSEAEIAVEVAAHRRGQ